jgi:polysaccharide chain length determinant protein (PEP-CTERM system associated)
MATNTSGNAFSVFTLLEALRRRWILIIAPAILLCAAAAFYAYRQPNVYRAQALIAAVNPGAPEYLREVAQEPLNLQEHLWTIREVLYSRGVLNEAAHELPEYRNLKGPVPDTEIDALKSGIALKVESLDTFHISYEGRNAQAVMDVINKAADAFVDRASAKHQEKVQDTKAVIDQQIDTLKSQLAQQDREVRTYKERAVNELPSTLDSNMKMAETLKQQYDGITSKIADDQAKKTMVAKEMAELENHGLLDQPVITQRTPNEDKLDALRLQEKELATKYTPKHPEVIRVQHEIQQLEAAIANSTRKPRTEPNPTFQKYTDLKSELQSIDQRDDSYRREQANLQQQIAAYQRRVEAAPQHERYLAEVEREYHVRESQLHDLLDKRLNTDLSGNLQKSESGISFALAEPASLPASPSSPQRSRLILMGLCAGLGLGLVAAFLLEQNDTTFATVDDFQTFTTVPVLTAIPTVPTTVKNATHLLVTATAPESVAAEQYRVLAMKIQQQSEPTSKVIMLTSAAGGEGKSMTAVNLANALASMSDGPVLLIDGDMRKPRVHEYLDLKTLDGRGFHDLLQKGDPDYSRHSLKVRNITVIPGSAPSGNPVAALSSQKARNLFEKFRQDFAYIIVDAPPTLPVADSHILAGLSDRVLFVVRARKTPRELFQHAVESFDSTNLIGAVLNDVDYQRSRYAYAYEYYKKSA